MLIGEKTKDGCTRVVVEISMTVYEAEKLRKEWAAYFSDYCSSDLKMEGDAAAGVILDLNHVSACDITGVQLLCSARKTADLNHLIFTVSEASTAVIEAVSDAGLEPDKLFAAA